MKQHEYREKFRKQQTFRFDCEQPYPSLDKMHSVIHDLETEMTALQESADLFEVNVPDYKQLKVIITLLLFFNEHYYGEGEVSNVLL